MLRKLFPGSQKYWTIMQEHKRRKLNHSRLIRYQAMQQAFIRDNKLNTILSCKPKTAFSLLKSSRRPENKKISQINVGDLCFRDNLVPDGIYHSIEQLKTEPISHVQSDPQLPNFDEEYRLILDICASGENIPPVSREKAFELLTSLRSSVNDYFSITSLHFLNAGEAGLDHFHLLMNAIIGNINLSCMSELNTIYAVVLFKGHGKDRENARSYRTISTCPLLSKAIDKYVREMSIEDWQKRQSPTQFQGPDMSHELASLLLTETLQYSLHVLKKPVYALFLDAKSAFDRTTNKILVRNLFLAGTNDKRLLYLNNWLCNRKTFCEYDKVMMGPICDTRGLEQGGISSSDEYKIYNNEQGIVAQSSNLGVPILNSVISCVSLADDTVLLSNHIYDLENLLFLTNKYCNKYDVTLVPEKTHLIAFHSKKDNESIQNVKSTSNISLNGLELPFSQQTEHLGVVRSESLNNDVCILDRMTAHRKQLFSILPAGLALHHSGNPAAALRVEKFTACQSCCQD